MNRTRMATAIAGVLALLAVAVDPVTAQAFDSITEQLIWDLNSKLLTVAIPITLLTEGILVYTVWKYRGNDDPQPTKENRRLEITWTVATAVVLLFVGFASFQVMANPAVTQQPGVDQATPDDAVVVEVVAQKYFWTFNYDGTNVSTRGELVLPADRPIVLRVTSGDWIHSFHVPGLGLKTDALPGQHNRLQTEISGTGTYQLYCAEYCGAGHSQMLGTVRVLPPGEYQDWLDQQQSESG